MILGHWYKRNSVQQWSDEISLVYLQVLLISEGEKTLRKEIRSKRSLPVRSIG